MHHCYFLVHTPKIPYVSHILFLNSAMSSCLGDWLHHMTTGKLLCHHISLVLIFWQHATVCSRNIFFQNMKELH